VLFAGAILAAQHSYTRAEVENGARLYQASCATCHGPKGDTVRGVALLSGPFRRATTDDEVARIIVNGIVGTAMPPNKYSDAEAGMIVAYLRGAASGDPVTALAGDKVRGKAIFDGKGNCSSCHNQTARMAPTLSDVGALRRPLEIEQSILDPSAELQADFRFIRATTKEGTIVRGRLLNQSSHSIQILDENEQLRAFEKSSLRDFEILKDSPMPSYRRTLSDQEVADVVSYLSGLRGQQ
jgi:putative heme-binding domain-containing protein